MGKVAYSSHYFPLRSLGPPPFPLPLATLLQICAVTYRMLDLCISLQRPSRSQHPAEAESPFRRSPRSRFPPPPQHYLSLPLRLCAYQQHLRALDAHIRKVEDPARYSTAIWNPPTPSATKWKASTPAKAPALEHYHDRRQGPCIFLSLGTAQGRSITRYRYTRTNRSLHNHIEFSL